MAKLIVTKAPCRSCHQDTSHKVIATRKNSDEEVLEDYGKVSWTDAYEMLECCGCQSVILRHTHVFSETPEPEVAYYPPPISRALPPWRYQLENELRSLLDEVYSALHTNSRRLALMGTRTMVDIVLTEKVGDSGSFRHKLEEMEHQGFVARKNLEILDAALDAGSAAAHRGFNPAPSHLNQVMDIVENLLQAVYVLQDSASQIRKATPKRKR